MATILTRISEAEYLASERDRSLKAAATNAAARAKAVAATKEKERLAALAQQALQAKKKLADELSWTEERIVQLRPICNSADPTHKAARIRANAEVSHLIMRKREITRALEV